MPTGQYFEERPDVPSARSSVRLTLPDLTVDLAADRGVFSGERVDAGTHLLLLEGALPDAGERALVDLGCGYGPIAITLATRAPDAEVWAVDVNERARQLCAENAAALGLANVRTVAPDDVPPDLAVDALWSNPPVRIGKGPLRDLLVVWLDRLVSGGRAELVVHRHLGADSLHRWLEEGDRTVERRCSRQGYRVLEVRRT